ncbi:unnamed protein product (macronuclear) [Paramecium tetraurelia]|uniref:C2 NT-type domain-containing protein n=1 Tax=Paramecium tetraurelia TaxID=5888 RepID=A0E481_PARTE|nr:uncharacterized protein GSPATT00023272001 [Paramecium tetraurelia]CAK90098.1 unnamed protein product [Paramecium tetraurelia]|eukprot:XP_001457495.1 hypothetical protein (macronuclear) [Paramecium tetraurelia strain d4-2]
MYTYTFILKVDNGYDLFDSKLFWKYHSSVEIKCELIKSRKNNLALFEIQAKEGSIEYYYENSKNEKEKSKRSINLHKDMKIEQDRFNCLNLMVKCQINSSDLTQNTQLNYIGKETRKPIAFQEQNLIYIPFQSEEKAQFLIEHQDCKDKLTEIEFHVLLQNLVIQENLLQLNIHQDDLENLIRKQCKKFKQQNGNVEFNIDSRNQKRFDEVLFDKYQECVSDTKQQSLRIENFSRETQKKFSDQIKKIDNFFSDEKQDTSDSVMQSNIQQSQIIPSKRYKEMNQKFRSTEGGFNKGTEKMKQEHEQKLREQKIGQELNHISEEKRQNDMMEMNIEQTTQLYVSIFDNSIENNDKQELIKIIKQKDEMINQLTTQINDLRVEVQDFAIKLNQEKENANDLAKRYQIKFIQNCRDRRFSPSKKNQINSKSQQWLQKDLMELNPTIVFAKQNYCEDLNQNSSTFYLNSTLTGFRQHNNTKSKTLKTEASRRNQ